MRAGHPTRSQQRVLFLCQPLPRLVAQIQIVQRKTDCSKTQLMLQAAGEKCGESGFTATLGAVDADDNRAPETCMQVSNAPRERRYVLSYGCCVTCRQLLGQSQFFNPQDVRPSRKLRRLRRA